MPSTPLTPSASSLRLGIIFLTLATAILHLFLGVTAGIFLFVLNGLGYLALLAALYLPIRPLEPYRNTTRWVLLGYTALTLVLWLIVGERNAAGYIDKVVELLLIALLLAEARQSR